MRGEEKELKISGVGAIAVRGISVTFQQIQSDQHQNSGRTKFRTPPKIISAPYHEIYQKRRSSSARPRAKLFSTSNPTFLRKFCIFSVRTNLEHTKHGWNLITLTAKFQVLLYMIYWQLRQSSPRPVPTWRFWLPLFSPIAYPAHQAAYYRDRLHL